jgi:hypothetical protein
MTVWVVLRNGNVDEVFDSYLSARHHQQQLTKLWASRTGERGQG